MYFMLDENVPQDVANMLIGRGHKAEFVREYVVPGAPDQVVATASEELEAVLISFDGDFEVISPRIPKGQRRRFRKLSRIWVRCSEPNRLRAWTKLWNSSSVNMRHDAPYADAADDQQQLSADRSLT
jgi:predicted nuclease of predicted toxin-antitoxin system